MQSLYDKATYEEIVARLHKISPDSKPIWGKMDVAQMLAHCNAQLDRALGKVKSKPDSNAFIRFISQLFFKKLLYNDQSYSRNLPTAPSLKVVDAKIFEDEKSKLLANIHEAHAKGLQSEWDLHPAFGYFSSEQWGKMFYKHLDHHFKQFNAV